MRNAKGIPVLQGGEDVKSAAFRSQKEKLDERFAKQAKTFYAGSSIGLFLVIALYAVELFK